MQLIEKPFGKEATLFVLKNENGIELAISDYGARIVSLKAPVNGVSRELVLGFDSAEEYADKDPYIGASIGRVAGRIRKGQFVIDETEYQLPVDPENGNNLHGGNGFDKRLWESEADLNDEAATVTFTLVSPDGDEGFPGNLSISVRYTLTADNRWIIDYFAETDQATLYNPTNHVYFNLLGDPGQSVGEHTLKLGADRFIEIDSAVLPTGNLVDVTGTPFDFRAGRPLEQVFTSEHPQNKIVSGLDHPFLLTGAGPQAILTSPDAAVAIEMTTDLPSVVIFTANFGEEGVPMRGTKIGNHGGVTLETQVPPGALEMDGLGEVILRPATDFHTQTTFKIVTK